MYSNTKYYYFWNRQGIRKYANLPISQKKGCGRLEFATSPEYLSIKMNYCLLLSNSIVNMLLFTWKNSIVNHAGSCSTGNQKQRQLQAHLGLTLGLVLDQKRRKPQVMFLCWLLLTHRAVARDAQGQRDARAPYVTKPGAASWHHPEVSSCQ